MKHTREQLDGMSDFERNELIVRLAYSALNIEKDRFLDLHSVHQDGNSNAAIYFANHKSGEVVAVGRFDFNNWNDIMPLAVEYGISVIKTRGGYVACKYELYIDTSDFDDINGICADGIQYGDESPQRAIACCLIMVLEAKE